jgi:hypothetical protein
MPHTTQTTPHATNNRPQNLLALKAVTFDPSTPIVSKIILFSVSSDTVKT